MSVSEQQITYIQDKLLALRQEIAHVVIGQDNTIHLLLTTLLAGGHALLEGVPGLAKTLLVRTLAQCVQLSFKRIQFTPDLMPTDVIGTDVLHQHTDGKLELEFRPGPIFANLLLADEINRTPPKTQSALLEAMQEQAVTYGGRSYALPKPFCLLATQNPIEQAGTYPLPEAQLDRFLLYVRMHYPDPEDERRVLRQAAYEQVYTPSAVMGADELLLAQHMAQQVFVDDSLIDWVQHCLMQSRPEQSRLPAVRQWIAWGAGTRAGQAWLRAAKAYAFLMGRYSVHRDDLRFLGRYVLQHRIVLNFEARAEGIRPEGVIQEIMA